VIAVCGRIEGGVLLTERSARVWAFGNSSCCRDTDAGGDRRLDAEGNTSLNVFGRGLV
jgi:hypothetical protein